MHAFAGVKRFGGEEVFPGDIIARQRGFKWHPGENTYYGRDHTIHAKCEVMLGKQFIHLPKCVKVFYLWVKKKKNIINQ